MGLDFYRIEGEQNWQYSEGGGYKILMNLQNKHTQKMQEVLNETRNDLHIYINELLAHGNFGTPLEIPPVSNLIMEERTRWLSRKIAGVGESKDQKLEDEAKKIQKFFHDQLEKISRVNTHRFPTRIDEFHPLNLFNIQSKLENEVNYLLDLKQKPLNQLVEEHLNRLRAVNIQGLREDCRKLIPKICDSLNQLKRILEENGSLAEFDLNYLSCIRFDQTISDYLDPKTVHYNEIILAEVYKRKYFEFPLGIDQAEEKKEPEEPHKKEVADNPPIKDPIEEMKQKPLNQLIDEMVNKLDHMLKNSQRWTMQEKIVKQGACDCLNQLKKILDEGGSLAEFDLSRIDPFGYNGVFKIKDYVNSETLQYFETITNKALELKKEHQDHPPVNKEQKKEKIQGDTQVLECHIDTELEKKSIKKMVEEEPIKEKLQEKIEQPKDKQVPKLSGIKWFKHKMEAFYAWLGNLFKHLGNFLFKDRNKEIG